MKKAGVLIGILVVIFLLNLITISAESCNIVPSASCPDANTTMKLSGTTNAHGALYNYVGTGYGYSLCCSFTGNHATSNRVLSLSSSPNGHAQVAYSANYPINITFGDLGCTNAAVSPLYPIPLLALSGTTNAHIANYTNANPTVYSTKISCRHTTIIPPAPCGNGAVDPGEVCDKLNDANCNSTCTGCNVGSHLEESICVEDITPTEPTFYWSLSPTGSPIPNPEVTKTIGEDKILWAFLRDSGKEPGTEINFSIYEIEVGKDSLGGGLIWDDQLINYSIGIVQVDGSANVSWVVTDAELLKADIGDGDATEIGNLDVDGLEGFYIEETNLINKQSNDIKFNIVYVDENFCVDRPVIFCSDYTEAECNLDECGVSDNINYPPCDATAFKRCEWNADAGDDGLCEWRPSCPLIDGKATGFCVFTDAANADGCLDGVLTYAWNGTWAWDPLNPISTTFLDDYVLWAPGEYRYDPNGESIYCTEGGTNTIECPEEIKLPFFGFFNIIAALSIIGVIYTLLSKRKLK